MNEISKKEYSYISSVDNMLKDVFDALEITSAQYNDERNAFEDKFEIYGLSFELERVSTYTNCYEYVTKIKGNIPSKFLKEFINKHSDKLNIKFSKKNNIINECKIFGTDRMLLIRFITELQDYYFKKNNDGFISNPQVEKQKEIYDRILQKLLKKNLIDEKATLPYISGLINSFYDNNFRSNDVNQLDIEIQKILDQLDNIEIFDIPNLKYNDKCGIVQNSLFSETSVFNRETNTTISSYKTTQPHTKIYKRYSIDLDDAHTLHIEHGCKVTFGSIYNREDFHEGTANYVCCTFVSKKNISIEKWFYNINTQKLTISKAPRVVFKEEVSKATDEQRKVIIDNLNLVKEYIKNDILDGILKSKQEVLTLKKK